MLRFSWNWNKGRRQISMLIQRQISMLNQHHNFDMKSTSDLNVESKLIQHPYIRRTENNLFRGRFHLFLSCKQCHTHNYALWMPTLFPTRLPVLLRSTSATAPAVCCILGTSKYHWQLPFPQCSDPMGDSRMRNLKDQSLPLPLVVFLSHQARSKGSYSSGHFSLTRQGQRILLQVAIFLYQARPKDLTQVAFSLPDKAKGSYSSGHFSLPGKAKWSYSEKRNHIIICKSELISHWITLHSSINMGFLLCRIQFDNYSSKGYYILFELRMINTKPSYAAPNLLVHDQIDIVSDIGATNIQTAVSLKRVKMHENKYYVFTF